MTTCLACPAYGTEACEVLELLGTYCDVQLAASEWAARSRAPRHREEARAARRNRPSSDRIH